jgi:hypothetical protein
MHATFLQSMRVSGFHTKEAYSNLGLTTEKYKINRKSGVKNV